MGAGQCPLTSALVAAVRRGGVSTGPGVTGAGATSCGGELPPGAGQCPQGHPLQAARGLGTSLQRCTYLGPAAVSIQAFFSYVFSCGVATVPSCSAGDKHGGMAQPKGSELQGQMGQGCPLTNTMSVEPVKRSCQRG